MLPPRELEDEEEEEEQEEEVVILHNREVELGRETQGCLSPL